jgi:hypothetical protein
MKLLLQVITVLTALAGLTAAVIKLWPSQPTQPSMSASGGSVQIVGSGNQVTQQGPTTVFALNPEVLREKSTYKNERFGFSMQYPKAWGHTNEPANGDGVYISAGSADVKITASGGWLLEDITPKFCLPQPGDMDSVALNSGKVAGFIEKTDGGKTQWDACTCHRKVCVNVVVEGKSAQFQQVRDYLMLVIKSLEFGKPYGA